MSYEMRIGLLAVITIAVTVWGYKFMKGKNLLSASNVYYVEYTDVDELTSSSAVYIRGLRVGTVTNISLGDDMTTVTATLDIDKGLKIHRETEAVIVSTSIMGGRAVVLNIPGPCEGIDCANSGDYLDGRVEGLVESLLGGATMDEVVDKVKEGLSDVFGPVSDTLAGPETLSAVAQSFRDIQLILSNLESITRQIDQNFPNYSRNIVASLENVRTLTGKFVEESDKLGETLDNLNSITADLKAAELGRRGGEFLSSTEEAVGALEETLAKADQSLDEITNLIARMNSGDGTIGKLLTDDSLYTNLNLTAHNLELLLQDFRLNPKRYVNVSVFGKKQKEYAVPEADPAYSPAVDERE